MDWVHIIYSRNSLAAVDFVAVYSPITQLIPHPMRSGGGHAIYMLYI